MNIFRISKVILVFLSIILFTNCSKDDGVVSPRSNLDGFIRIENNRYEFSFGGIIITKTRNMNFFSVALSDAPINTHGGLFTSNRFVSTIINFQLPINQPSIDSLELSRFSMFNSSLSTTDYTFQVSHFDYPGSKLVFPDDGTIIVSKIRDTYSLVIDLKCNNEILANGAVSGTLEDYSF